MKKGHLSTHATCYNFGMYDTSEKILFRSKLSTLLALLVLKEIYFMKILKLIRFS